MNEYFESAYGEPSRRTMKRQKREREFDAMRRLGTQMEETL